MKIALVSEYFYPQSKGGTEKYVYELAKKLISERNEVEIITSANGVENYHYDEISVRVLKEEKSGDQLIISGSKPAHNLNSFITLLKEQQYELIHFHTLTPSFGIHHVNSVKTLGLKIYFTAHVPTVTCIHGDLMLYGQMACDGKIINQRCMSCYISKKQIPKELAILFARLIYGLKYPKSIANVVKQKQQDIFNLNALCDRIFIFTNWQKRIFIENGIEEAKLSVTQQMIIPEPDQVNKRNFITNKNEKTKIGFAGRVCHEKGLHILLDAFLASKNENLVFYIAAVIENQEDPYFMKLKQLTAGYTNIYWSYNLTESEMQAFYQMVDLIVIPSISYETGPYVLYEAFKYKLSVIANNLGDMKLWSDKGYNVKVYNNKEELSALIKQL